MSFYAKLTAFIFLILGSINVYLINIKVNLSYGDYVIPKETYWVLSGICNLLFLFGIGLSINYNKIQRELSFLISKLKFRTFTAKWNKVKIMAKEETQFGIISDKDGELTVVSRRPGEDWPHGMKPSGGINQINKGFTSYIITDE